MADAFEGMSDDELRDEITTWAGRVAAGEAKLLLLIGELDERGAWALHGVRSCAHWLTWRLGMSAGPARERVRVARCLRELPLITGAFSRGELSWSQVRALTRLATPAAEGDLLAAARRSTGAQLERWVRGIRRAQQPAEDAVDPEQAAWRRRPRIRYDEEGTMVMTLRLPAEQGQLVLAALEHILTELPEVPAGTSAPTLADALVHLCSRKRITASKGRARLKVLLDPLTGWARSADGELLPPGTVPAAVTAPAEPLPLNRFDRGRDVRDAPGPLRALLGQVDGERCRFPGCRHVRHLHAHHVLWWQHGGRTDLANLVLMCSYHHQYLHRFGYLLELLPDRRLTVTAPTGSPVPLDRELLWQPVDTLDPWGAVTATTLPPQWDGSGLDLDHAVWAYLHRAAA